jgi:hypothetical protein
VIFGTGKTFPCERSRVINFLIKFTPKKIFMSTAENISIEDKIQRMSEDLFDFYRGGYFYELIPEKLKATLDEQALIFYEILDQSHKGFDKINKKLIKIIKEQYPVFTTVKYSLIEDDILDAICDGFNHLIYQTWSLGENSKDKQPLRKIYAHLGLWNQKNKPLSRSDKLLKNFSGHFENVSDSNLTKLFKENKVFELLNYQNNEENYKTVYDVVKKVLVAQFPATKQFGETEWSIYDALFEKGNYDFRIKLFLIELKLDGNINTDETRGIDADKIIEKFSKLPQDKRDGINKLAERRMMGEKV